MKPELIQECHDECQKRCYETMTMAVVVANDRHEEIARKFRACCEACRKANEIAMKGGTISP